jgi:mRNA interferase RelE/StbE
MIRSLYALEVPPLVADQLRGLHPQLKRKLRAALDAVLADPRAGKPLRDDLLGLWSFRVGRFRLVYRLRGQCVVLMAFGPRDSIYEETARLVARSGDKNSVAEPRGRYKTKSRRR